MSKRTKSLENLRNASIAFKLASETIQVFPEAKKSQLTPQLTPDTTPVVPRPSRTTSTHELTPDSTPVVPLSSFSGTSSVVSDSSMRNICEIEEGLNDEEESCDGFDESKPLVQSLPITSKTEQQHSEQDDKSDEEIYFNLLEQLSSSLNNSDETRIARESSYLTRHLNLSQDKLKKYNKRIEDVFEHIRKVLNPPVKWNLTLETKFKDFFNMFCNFLASLEGMHSVELKTPGHFEQETEWESGFALELKLSSLLRNLYPWCTSKKEVLVNCIQTTIDHLKQRKHAMATTTSDGARDHTRTPVSLHIPLTRLLSGLLVEYGKLGDPWNQAEFGIDILDLAENAMQTICLSAQVSAGLWQNKDFALCNGHYRHHRYRSEMFDRDLQMLQLCAALDPEEQFFPLLRKHMNLKMPGIDNVQMTRLYEEFFSLLIFICEERYVEGIAEVSSKDIAKREIIHYLANKYETKDYTMADRFANSVRVLYSVWQDASKEFVNEGDKLISGPEILETMGYHIEKDLLDQVSPFYYHYSSVAEQTQTLNRVIRKRKRKFKPCYFTCPNPPPFTTMFQKVPEFLKLRSFVDFLEETLSLLIDKKNSKWSDKFGHKLFYLIWCAIYEEREEVKKDPRSCYNFCELAKTRFDLRDKLLKLEKKVRNIHQESISCLHRGIEEIEKRRAGIDPRDPVVMNIERFEQHFKDYQHVDYQHVVKQLEKGKNKSWLYRKIFLRHFKSFSTFNLLVALFSIGMYIFDVGSDFLNAYTYYINRHNIENSMVYFGLTMFFILVPSITMHAYSLWKQKESLRWHKNKNTTKNNFHYYTFLVAHILHVGLIYRILRAVYFGRKKQKGVNKEHNNKKWIYEGEAVCKMRLFETFLEAIPQLILQVYIMLTTVQAPPITVLACLGSVGGLSLSMHDNEVAHININLSKFEILFYVLYQSLTVLSRVLAFSLLLMLNVWAGIGLALLHFLIVAYSFKLTILLNRDEGKTIPSSLANGIIFTFTVPYLDIDNLLNLKKPRHRQSPSYQIGIMLVFLIEILIENCIIAGIWFKLRSGTVNVGTALQPSHPGVPQDIAIAIVVFIPAAFVLGILCLLGFWRLLKWGRQVDIKP